MQHSKHKILSPQIGYLEHSCPERDDEEHNSELEGVLKETSSENKDSSESQEVSFFNYTEFMLKYRVELISLAKKFQHQPNSSTRESKICSIHARLIKFMGKSVSTIKNSCHWRHLHNGAIYLIH